MVVEEHDANGVHLQRNPNDVAAGDQCAGHGSDEDLALLDHVLSSIEQHGAEVLLRFVGVTAHQSAARDSVVVSRCVGGIGCDPRGDFERGFDACRFRRSDSVRPCDGLDRAAAKRAEAAGEELACKLNRVFAARPRAEQDRQKLGVGERFGTVAAQFLARPVVERQVSDQFRH